MIPFSSKSCWCLKVKDCPSLSFLTKTKDDRSKSYHCLATWREETSLHQTRSRHPPRWGRRDAASSPFSAGTAPEIPQWRAAPSSTCDPSGQSEPSHLALAPDGNATSSSRSEERTRAPIEFVFQETHRPQSHWHTGFRTQLGLTCRLYKEPGVSYRCRGRRSIDSRTAISFRIKATAGWLQRTGTSTVNDLYERLFLSLTCERHRGGSKTVDNRKYRLFPSECCFYIF